MNWTRRKRKWDWRAFLTKEELAEVRELDRKIETAQLDRAENAALLDPIRNRAIQRAIHAARS